MEGGVTQEVATSASVMARRKVEMAVDYALSSDIREKCVERGRSDRNRTGQRSAGTAWRLEEGDEKWI